MTPVTWWPVCRTLTWACTVSLRSVPLPICGNWSSSKQRKQNLVSTVTFWVLGISLALVSTKSESQTSWSKREENDGMVQLKLVVPLSPGESGGGWMMNRVREGHKYFFNVHTMEYSWNRPDGVKKDHGLLTKEEIQVVSLSSHQGRNTGSKPFLSPRKKYR